MPPSPAPGPSPEPEPVRPATLADLAEIHALITAAYTRYLARMDKPPGPMLTDYTRSVEAGHTWVIGSPVIGVISLEPAAGHLLIENVAVRPQAQGRGLGHVLMDFAEQEAARRGLTCLTLYTHEVMTENLAMYAHLGYREVDRRADSGYRRVFMEKRLPG